MKTLRPVAVRSLRGGPDQLRGCPAQRRLGERPAPPDQALRQGIQGPQRVLGHRGARHRSRRGDAEDAVGRGNPVADGAGGGAGGRPACATLAIPRLPRPRPDAANRRTWPDFNTTTPIPTEIKLHQQSKLMEITFADGQLQTALRVPARLLPLRRGARPRPRQERCRPASATSKSPRSRRSATTP